MTGPVAEGWNFAEMWERNADRFGAAVAQVQGGRSTTWADFDRRADGVAAALLGAGLGHQAKVAQYLYNCPEYLESTFAAFKAGLAPVNTNYRYTTDELAYLWDDADAEAVVFHGTFVEQCERTRARVPRVRTWVWVDDGTAPCPAWAVPYEEAAASATGRTVPAWGRSPDDLFLLYTGGTTGMPKGVMWRQDDLVGALDAPSKHPLPAAPGWDEFDGRFARPGPRNLPAAPLMHGTGAFNAMWNLVMAGSVVTSEHRSFDATATLDEIELHRVGSVTIVGDAFAKPVLRALDAAPGRWDLSSLRILTSSGVMWSAETKAGLLRHVPRLLCVDSFGSSEAVGMATHVTRGDGGGAGGGTDDGAATTARFRLGAGTKVLTEDGHEVEPGSGELGRIALRGRTPIGYHKDQAKSAATFVEHDGVRWSIPGDWAEVLADGSLRLHGRGSQCINTGGEKVFPEEVEEALKRHPSVSDAAVVGLPDERFGQAVTALVELEDGAELDEAALVAHVRRGLAAYKSPKRILSVPTVGRAPNGKLDYKRFTAHALERTT